jgi:hypothetical protein
LGGGGTGGTGGSTNGTPGTTNIGGGGGAGGGYNFVGGAGGSGVVIVRVPSAVTVVATGGYILSTVGTNKLYTFTSSGTITF